ncbi:phytanoyl-CoA dioxygenase family protein [Rugosimonospora africana]|uniref:phytanoyl-CoA dioxygenase family protein n=1 Tax=Rugosimonospora africana TaxID=556532 RepID=UPI00194369BF|nr:phytanoyl-CoA dioxygenase family protein [Rugosimonospora africana]
MARQQRDPQTGAVQEVDIRSRFEATGVVRLDSAFTADQATAMRNAMWQHAESQAGLRPADPASWAGSPVLNWQGLSRDPVFRPLVDNRAVSDALDAIFGAGGWRRPRPGAQILFSLPEPDPWVLPDGWHMDCGFDHATWPVPAVKLFAFVGEVGPRGGGTMVVSGTHRLVDRYRETLPTPVGAGRENWLAFMRRYPWLARLLDGAGLPDRGRPLVGEAGEIDGVPVQVVELTGSPGDVVVTHLHVFHARSPDTGTAPRLMLGKEVRRA